MRFAILPEAVDAVPLLPKTASDQPVPPDLRPLRGYALTGPALGCCCMTRSVRVLGWLRVSHPLRIISAHSCRGVWETLWMSPHRNLQLLFYFHLAALLSVIAQRALGILTEGSAFPSLFWTNHCSLIGLLAKSWKETKRLWHSIYWKSESISFWKSVTKVMSCASVQAWPFFFFFFKFWSTCRLIFFDMK